MSETARPVVSAAKGEHLLASLIPCLSHGPRALFYGAIWTWPLPPVMNGGSPLKIVVNASAG